MLYFAYGSNLSTKYVRQYTPSAVFVRRALLSNFHIEFRRYSDNLKGGISTIIEAPGEMVHGVIYEVDPKEIAALDILEKVPLGVYKTGGLQGPRRGWGMVHGGPLPRREAGGAVHAGEKVCLMDGRGHEGARHRPHLREEVHRPLPDAARVLREVVASPVGFEPTLSGFGGRRLIRWATGSTT